jgi:hypothetical protein
VITLPSLPNEHCLAKIVACRTIVGQDGRAEWLQIVSGPAEYAFSAIRPLNFATSVNAA